MIKKTIILAAVLFSFFLFISCNSSDDTDSENQNNANLKIRIDAGTGIKSNQLFSSSIINSVEINDYAVTSLVITIKNATETETIGSANWSPGDSSELQFTLEWNKSYKLYVTHQYTDMSGEQKKLEEGPYTFMIRKGYITEITITPGGAVTVVDNNTDQTPPCYIIGFQPSYTSPLAEGTTTWIDILITDAIRFRALGNFSITVSSGSYLNVQMTGDELPQWNIQDNQIIRIHGSYYTGATDTAINENNPGIWDFKSANRYGFSNKFGIIYIAGADGKLIDIISFTTDANSGSDWLTGAPAATLADAVNSGFWNGTTKNEAFNLGSPDVNNGTLKDINSDGNSADDWMRTSPLNSGFSISGKITSGETPVIGAEITLSGTGLSALTSATGEYIISNVPEGSYDIIAVKEGFTFFSENYSWSIAVNGNISNVNFSAIPESGPAIHDIQGESHSSPIKDSAVTGVTGIVTAVSSRGFYLQGLNPDKNDKTSEAIYVFTSSKPTAEAGDIIAVDGKITEYYGLTSDGNLSLTEIITPTIRKYFQGSNLPEPVLLGSGGRKIPSEIVCDDASGNVNASVFDPENDGIDFYESLECMLVKINNARVVAPTNSYGEIAMLADNGEDSGMLTPRGGILLRENDFNPEIIRTDDILTGKAPKVYYGDVFNGAITGVIDFAYGCFKLYNIQTMPSVTPGGLQKEVSSLLGDAESLTVATYNVENFSAVSPDSKADSIASDIVSSLGSPDIINLVEIMDSNGETGGVTDASLTYQKLINAVKAAGGPDYSFRDIAPEENMDGGVPGGNIRVGFLFNPEKVTFIDRAGGTSTSAVTVSSVDNEAQISFSPGRIDPLNAAFNDSRKALVGEFLFNGRKVYVIGNHFCSKGGDTPIFGYIQPMILNSEIQRNLQAEVISSFIGQILSAEPAANIILLGDLNDFQFSNPLKKIDASGLYNLIYSLPENDRYSYNYQGNSQALDHIFVSQSIKNLHPEIDAVHINSEFSSENRSSDHDPLLAKITFQ